MNDSAAWGEQGWAAVVEEGLPESPAAPVAYAVPNVSEGLDRLTIRALVGACLVQGVRVVDLHSDPDYNRSVLTLAGEPLALQEALVALAAECMDRIDLRRHRGVHPRVGALDVAPIVARTPEDMPLASEIAVGLAARLGEELRLPVFQYGAIASDPSRVTPADFRDEGLEGLERELEEGTLLPDAGPPRLHPTAGAVLVGARPPLIAMNAWLPHGSVTEARVIAARVRESGGGPRGLRALGLYLPEAHMAQVSMNLIDHRATPPAVALGAVRAEGDRLGVEVGDVELVGLIPRAALRGGPSPSALRISGFRPGMVLEAQIPGLGRAA